MKFFIAFQFHSRIRTAAIYLKKAIHHTLIVIVINTSYWCLQRVGERNFQLMRCFILSKRGVGRPFDHMISWLTSNRQGVSTSKRAKTPLPEKTDSKKREKWGCDNGKNFSASLSLLPRRDRPQRFNIDKHSSSHKNFSPSQYFRKIIIFSTILCLCVKIDNYFIFLNC